VLLLTTLLLLLRQSRFCERYHSRANVMNQMGKEAKKAKTEKRLRQGRLTIFSVHASLSTVAVCFCSFNRRFPAV
jgi:hypothetical protein